MQKNLNKFFGKDSGLNGVFKIGVPAEYVSLELDFLEGIFEKKLGKSLVSFDESQYVQLYEKCI